MTAGCTPDPRPADGRAAATQDETGDAALLGRAVYHLLDRVHDYEASHGGRLPPSVAALGIDSLAPATVQRLRARNDSIVATVAFRDPASRALGWCEATTEALEEASLSAGSFTVWCGRSGGGADSFSVAGPR